MWRPCGFSLTPIPMRSATTTNLPLHVATTRCGPIPVRCLLIERNPEALRARNADGLFAGSPGPPPGAVFRPGPVAVPRALLPQQRAAPVRGVREEHEVEPVLCWVEQRPESTRALAGGRPRGGSQNRPSRPQNGSMTGHVSCHAGQSSRERDNLVTMAVDDPSVGRHIDDDARESDRVPGSCSAEATAVGCDPLGQPLLRRSGPGGLFRADVILDWLLLGCLPSFGERRRVLQ